MVLITQLHWVIRLYVPYDESEGKTFVGNAEDAGRRYLDEIVVFSGMYGTPDYLIWKIHKDLDSYNFSLSAFELKLYESGDRESAFYYERYRVFDVYDDLKNDKKIVYAISESSAKLDTKLIDYGVSTLEYLPTRTTEDLLREVLELNGIFAVIFCEHKEFSKQSLKFEYSKFTLNPMWSVRDFIEYIAKENNFEWTVKKGILHIGPEIYAYKELRAAKEFINKNVDNISKSIFFTKIAFAASPLDVMYSYDMEIGDQILPYRCIWAMHTAGASGDTTKGCFVRIGQKIHRKHYFDSLEDQRIPESRYNYNPLFPYITVGRVTYDSGDFTTIEEISTQRNVDKFNVKTPADQVIETKDPLYMSRKVGRTTPYLEHEGGMLFPITLDPENNPNCLVFHPDGRTEEAVIGPFVYGNGEFKKTGNPYAFFIPIKNDHDFRFSLPRIPTGTNIGKCGPTLYISGEGNSAGTFAYQPVGWQYDDINPNPDLPQLFMLEDGSFATKLDDYNYISLIERPTGSPASERKIKLVTGDGYIEIIAAESILIKRAKGSQLQQLNLKDDGTISIYNALGNISVDSGDKAEVKGTLEVNIESDTVINLTTTGTVNIGASATAVNIAGGANALAHAGHTHTYIPGTQPSASTGPSSSNTTKTKAD